jgi:hypothetical protein
MTKVEAMLEGHRQCPLPALEVHSMNALDSAHSNGYGQFHTLHDNK